MTAYKFLGFCYLCLFILFENTLIEAWSLDDDGETFYKILEDNGIQINEDGNELKLEHNLQEWLWEGEDAGWFD